MLFNQVIRIVLRLFLRNSAFSLLNLTGLATGMACSLIIYLWIADERSYDRHYPDYKQMYRVVETQYYSGSDPFPVAVTPAGLNGALLRDIPGINAATRYTNRWYKIKKNEELTNERICPVDTSFPRIFGLKFVQGNPAEALKNPLSVVLSETMAEKYFGNESSVGKSLHMDNKEFTVTGVFKDVKPRSHISYDLLVPFETIKHEYYNDSSKTEDFGNNSYYTYVIIQQGIPIDTMNARIKNLIKKYNPSTTTELELQPMKDIHLYSGVKYAADVYGHGDIQYVRIFSLVAIIILVIACLNFMILATAQSAQRAREAGVRKLSGSSRTSLWLQFIGESLLYAIAAHVIALILVELLLPGISQLTGKELNLNYLSWSFFPIVFGIILFTGFLAGCYPALMISAFKPVQVLRSGNVISNGGSGFRKALIFIQFVLSISLLISTLTIYRQVEFIRNKKLGYNRENVVYFWLNQEFKNSIDAAKDELLKNPHILASSIANQTPLDIQSSSSQMTWEGKDPSSNLLFHYIMVDPDFLTVTGMEMKEGRFFSREFPGDSATMIINEKAAGIMNLKDPVGTKVSWGPFSGIILGIVKDFNFKNIRTPIEPMVMFNYTPLSWMMMIKTDGKEMEKTIHYIESVYKKYAKDNLFHLNFLDADYNNLYKAEVRMGSIFAYFAGLAVFIACLGLVGLSAFMAQKRTKEICIRKIHGAGTYKLLEILSKEFIQIILLSNILSWPLAGFAMNRWLNNFAYHINIPWWIFVVSGVFTFLLSLGIISMVTLKSVNRKPSEALRYE